MVIVRLLGRAVPRLRGGPRAWSRRAPALPPPGQVRCMQRGPFSRDPFTQMEGFMRDMERRFRNNMEDTMGSMMRSFPARGLPSAGALTRSSQPAFGEMENLSTTEKYKLNFYFSNAKPEDIKVTLKGHSLQVTGEAKVETETSKSSHEMSVEMQLPEDVVVDGLESCLSQEGVLTVEAPRNPAANPEAPKAIPIERQ